MIPSETRPSDETQHGQPKSSTIATMAEAIPSSSSQPQTTSPPSSTPVEMSQLSSQMPATTSDPATTGGAQDPGAQASSSGLETSPPSSEPTTFPIPSPTNALTSNPAPSTATTTSPTLPPIQTAQPTTAIATTTARPAPATPGILSALPDSAPDGAFPIAAAQPTSPDGPSVQINLILLNGARHPFKIDQKYLRKRNVGTTVSGATGSVAMSTDAAGTGDETGDKRIIDPFGISIYTLKELIWRDWREEWDPRPGIPSSITLIFFGRRLEDKMTLRDSKFHPTNPNVVHMTVKPQSLVDEEENAKLHQKSGGGGFLGRGRRSSGLGGGGGGGAGGVDGESQAGCCRCSIM